MLSYASVPLPLLNSELTPDAAAFISRYSPLDRIRDRDTGRYYGSGEILNFPIPSQPRESPPELGVLWWPTGASECATFSSVVNVSALALIRTASAASEFNDLVISDGTNTITASMKIASVHPLFQIDDTEQLYLLTLVDIRYNWWWKPGSLTQSTTWAALFAQFGTLLDVTIDAADVNAAYAIPSIRWTTYYKPLPTLLDAAATYVGQRVVAALDGTISTVLAADANTNADTQLASFQKIIGGDVVHIDIYNTIPGNVVTVFGQTNAMGIPQASPYTQSTSLASLSLVGYDGSTGLAELTATVFADLIYDTTNLSDCNALATQAATDWYNWNLADVDVTLPGIQPWTPTGSETAIEWTYAGDDRLLTRIIREPWQVLPTGSFELSTTEAPTVTGCVVTNVCPVFSSGVQVGIMVEKTCPDGTITCTLNPSNCCAPTPPPPIACSICGSIGIPQTLYISATGPDGFSCTAFKLLAGGGGTSCSWGAGDAQVPPCGVLNPNNSPWTVHLDTSPPILIIPNPSGEGPITLNISSCDPFCATASGVYPEGIWGTTVGGTYNFTVTSSSSGTCGDPDPSWNCNTNTGACVEVFDGSGAYTSLSACNENCGAGASSWNCVSGSCVQIGGTGGTYPTEAACISAGCGVSPPPSGCPTSGTPTITVTGLSGLCTIGNGSWTTTIYEGDSTFLFENTGCNRGSASPCFFQAQYQCTSSTTGIISISGFCGSGDTQGWTAVISVTGTASPLDMSGTGTIIGNCCVSQSVMVTVT